MSIKKRAHENQKELLKKFKILEKKIVQDSVNISKIHGILKNRPAEFSVIIFFFVSFSTSWGRDHKER